MAKVQSGSLNFHANFLVVLFLKVGAFGSFFLFLVYDIQKLCCVHWIKWFSRCCCLAFRMQPRLYFSLLRSNIEKLSNIHYDFFFPIRYPLFVFGTHSYCCYIFSYAVSSDNESTTQTGTTVTALLCTVRMCHRSCPSICYIKFVQRHQHHRCLRISTKSNLIWCVSIIHGKRKKESNSIRKITTLKAFFIASDSVCIWVKVS